MELNRAYNEMQCGNMGEDGQTAPVDSRLLTAQNEMRDTVSDDEQWFASGVWTKYILNV